MNLKQAFPKIHRQKGKQWSQDRMHVTEHLRQDSGNTAKGNSDPINTSVWCKEMLHN